MKTTVFFIALVLNCGVVATPQSRWPKPPSPSVMNPEENNKTSASTPKSRIDPLQLQREAHELSELASSLPADIDHVNHGLLPKDTIDKLKRIEKLSKHLRSQVQP
jgi:hypothetical protein